MSPERKQTLKYLASKAPEITVLFWVLKLLTTGMGEAMSDFLGSHSIPIGGSVGFFGMLLAFYLQFKQDRYRAPYYWFTVMMVAVFGTMVADAIHDGAAIGYDVTTPLFGLFTGLVFWRWWSREGTLDIHTIDSVRRERYYWLAVLGTFAFGTAAGDLTAIKLGLGFFDSILLFGAVMLIPLIGWSKLGWNAIFCFWFAYIDTRPLGASFADWFSKPASQSGLGFGDGKTALVALLVFVMLVGYKTVSGHGIQADQLALDGRLATAGAAD